MLWKQFLIRERTIKTTFKTNSGAENSCLKETKPSSRAPDPNPCPWHAPQLQAISGKLLYFKALGTRPDSGGPSLPVLGWLSLQVPVERTHSPDLLSLPLRLRCPSRISKRTCFYYLHHPLCIFTLLQTYTHWNMGSWKTEHGCLRSCWWEGQPSLL